MGECYKEYRNSPSLSCLLSVQLPLSTKQRRSLKRFLMYLEVTRSDSYFPPFNTDSSI